MVDQEAKRAFIARLWAPLAGYALSDQARELVVAHGALECGWGASSVSRHAFNHWNLTAGTRWLHGGKAVFRAGDLEYPPEGGAPRRITQPFRRYATDDEAVADYVAFLRESSRYRAAFAQLRLAAPGEFVKRLRDDDPRTPEVEGGFFTAPLAEYQQGFAARLAEVRRIRRDDQAARELLEQGRAKVETITGRLA